jgi:hypothetical protein
MGNFGYSKKYVFNRRGTPKGDDSAMKKYKWLFVGIAVLLLTTAIVLNVSARPTNSMGSECAEDGSCCEDEDTCTCG